MIPFSYEISAYEFQNWVEEIHAPPMLREKELRQVLTMYGMHKVIQKSCHMMLTELKQPTPRSPLLCTGFYRLLSEDEEKEAIAEPSDQ